MKTPLNVFIGYDPRETVAFYAAAHSIWEHASVPVAIHRCSPEAMGVSRQKDPKQSTDFAFCRFAVPSVMDYKGWALFIDCDIILRDDVAKLFALADPDVDLMVVKHDYEPKDSTKFLGQVQTAYPKKNWSSVMLFNNERCRRLSRHYVNTAPGLELHQFGWAGRIGALGEEWNHLVGEYKPNEDAKLVHYTLGGPYFNEYNGCEFSDEWWDVYKDMTSCEQRSSVSTARIKYAGGE